MYYKREGEKRIIPYSVRGKSAVKFCSGCLGKKRTLTPKGKKKPQTHNLATSISGNEL